MTHYENEKEDLLAYFEQMLFDAPEERADAELKAELEKSNEKPPKLQSQEDFLSSRVLSKVESSQNISSQNTGARKFLSSKKNHPQCLIPKTVARNAGDDAHKKECSDKVLLSIHLSAQPLTQSAQDLASADTLAFAKDAELDLTQDAKRADEITADVDLSTSIDELQMEPQEAIEDFNAIDDAEKAEDKAVVEYADGYTFKISDAQNLNTQDFYPQQPEDPEIKPQQQSIEEQKTRDLKVCERPSIASLLEALNTQSLLDEEVIDTPKEAVATQDETIAKIATEQITAEKSLTETEDAVISKLKTDVENATAIDTLAINTAEPQVITKASNVKTFPQLTDTLQHSRESAQSLKSAIDELPASLNWSNISLDDEFQVLFFLVKGVRFAVPLLVLGGIYEINHLTKIAKRPDWYLGLADMRGEKISVVDTLRYVKPEDTAEHSYQYMIVLNHSKWALGADVLEGNRIIEKTQVKFRQKALSRPYLAGIVKKEMCALLHVPALIAMLDRGLALDALQQE